MKPVGSFSKLIGYAVAVGCVSLAWSVQAELLNGKAVVRAVRGTAQFNAKNAGYKPVKVGHIYSGDTIIKTLPSSQVDLFLGDNGPVLRTTADTELTISKLTVETVANEKVIETQLDLRSGRILGNVKKMAQASKYEVKTPRGVASIRGSEFDIRADGTVIMATGTAIVGYRLPNGGISTVTVGPNQQGNPPVGNNPATVTPVNPNLADFPRDPILSVPGDLPPPPDSPFNDPNPSRPGDDRPPLVAKPAGQVSNPPPVTSPTTGVTGNSQGNQNNQGNQGQ